jgi:DUF1707 SHOCT-like domain
MDTATRDYPPGDIRVSDADRDRALSELSEHFQAGRLTKEEFDERSGQALQTKTGKELRALLADLPRSQQNPGPPPAPVSGPGGLQPRRPWILPVAPIIFVAIAVALLTGGHGHHGLGVIAVPVVVVLLIFLRLMRGGPRRGPRGWRY